MPSAAGDRGYGVEVGGFAQRPQGIFMLSGKVSGVASRALSRIVQSQWPPSALRITMEPAGSHWYAVSSLRERISFGRRLAGTPS